MRSLLSRPALAVVIALGLVSIPGLLPSPAIAQPVAPVQSAAEEVIAYLESTSGPVAVADVPRFNELGAPPWLSYLPSRSRDEVRAWEMLVSRLDGGDADADGGGGGVGDAIDEQLPPVMNEAETVSQVGLNDTIETGEIVEAFGRVVAGDRASHQVAGVRGYLAGSNAGGDVDVFLVSLTRGEVISVGFGGPAFSGDTQVEILDPDRVVRMGASINPRLLYPAASPLLQDGDVAVDHVAATDGVHAVVVSGGTGAYVGEFRRARTGLRTEVSDLADARADATQILFVDFDGATTDPNRFNPFSASIDVDLSPLSVFLSSWDLLIADENAVIDGVLAEMVASIDDDPRLSLLNGDRDVSGIPGTFDVEIRNSRDHADPWGQANVSRIIIGGSIAELGLPVVGVAESTDPGNLVHEESAVVLLDLLSRPAGRNPTLNNFDVANGSTKAALVAQAVGRVAAHEAGHLLGNWHTDASNAIHSLSDAGGDLGRFVGVGDDEVFGTDDDTNIGFVDDDLSPDEGFSGVEQPLNRVAHGLATPADLGAAPTPTPGPQPSPEPTPTATPAPTQSAYVPHELPGRIEAEDYDNGGQGVAFNDVDEYDNRGGQYRDDPVDIWTTVGEPDGLTVGATRGGEWLEYSVDLDRSATFALQVRMASAYVDPGGIEVSIDGVSAGTVDVGASGTGGWWQWNLVDLGQVTVEEGPHVVRLAWLDAGQINVDWLAFVEQTPVAENLVPGRIEAEAFDDGGPGVAYNDTNPENVGGALRDTGVDIYPTYNEPGGYTIGQTVGGEWIEFTVDATVPGIYNIDARIASGSVRSGSIAASVNGVRSGVARPLRTGWWSWSVERVSQVYLTPGTHVLRITWNRGGDVNLDWVSLTLADR